MKWVKRIIISLLIVVLSIVTTAFIAAAFYKKEIAALVVDNLRDQYGLKLSVEAIDISFINNWPRTSINLKNTSVRSETNQKTESPFLKAGTISISINIIKLLQNQFIIKNITLKDVDLNLIKYADGSKNFEIKKSSNTNQVNSSLDLNLNKISLKNVKFKFSNEEKGQILSFRFSDNTIQIKNFEDGMFAKFDGSVLINGLLFNPKAGEFLTNTRTILQLACVLNFKEKLIAVLPPSNAEIEGHTYNLSALIDLSEKKTLSLVIESKGVKSERVATYLTPKIKKVLSNFEVKRLLDAKVILIAQFGIKQDPIIIADIIGKDCDLSIGENKIPYSNLNFHGKVLSMHPSREKGDMEHARITFTDITGNIYNFPFKANITIHNLSQPTIDLEASLVIDGKNINQEITNKFTIRGKALATIKYSGDAKKLNKAQFLNDSMNLNAYLLFNDLSYKENNSPFLYTLNGKANLKKHFLYFENLNLRTAAGNLNIKGKVDEFLKYVLGMTNNLKANVDAHSDLIDLNPILTSENSKDKKQKEKSSEKFKESVFDFKINLTASKLLIRKIECKNAKVDMDYKNDLILIRDFQVQTCDGEISANGRIENLNKISTHVTIKNVDASKLFVQFENFGQDAVRSENIQGKVFVEASLSAELDKNNEFKGESMKADAKVKLVDGHLINFEPIQNISNFIFKKRDFTDVSFSELKETFKVRGFELKIDELEIASNVLNLFIVNGLYSMKSNSNFNMLIPWSNLKKRGKNYVPKESGESASNTRGLKLNYSGPPQHMKLSFGHKEQEKRFW